MLIIFAVTISFITYSENASATSGSAEGPLILTSLLKSGRIEEARKQSEVPPILPNVTSNAAFFTVNDTYNSNLFFWFFRKSKDDWIHSPLLLWFHGGAAAAFMTAVFLETGPFEIHEKKIKPRKYSWTNDYNVLYVDQPVGNGYSFTDYDDGLITSTEEAAVQVHEALIQFYMLYPELRNNTFYITCESYGCRFGVAVMKEIHERNINIDSFINLGGIFMGSGFVDPASYFEYGDHLHKVALIDFRTKNKFQELEERGKGYVRAGLLKEAHAIWRSSMNLFKNLTSGLDHNNIIDQNYGKDKSFIEYVTSDRMRQKLHVGNAVFNFSSPIVFDHLMNDHFKSQITKIEKLLEIYPFLMVSGQLDLLISPSSNAASLKDLRWSGTETFHLAERQRWYENDVLIGYYTRAHNLLHVFLRDSGHMVSISRPRCILKLLNKFINDEL